MTIDELVQNGGIVKTINPNYNIKSKKNKEPQVIDSYDLNKGIDYTGIAEAALNAETNNPLFNYKEYHKYFENGINPNLNNLDTIDKQLAEAQSNWTKVCNSLAQTLVSEIGLGTVTAFVDIADFIGTKVFGIGGEESDDYQNDVSAYLTNLREEFNNEVAPIYTDPNIDISNGGFGNVGWWASQAPSIMSSLTLLLPSKAILFGAGKLFSAIGKTAKAANTASKGTTIGAFTNKSINAVSKSIKESKLGKTLEELRSNAKVNYYAKGIAQTAPDALLMRTMENYQEARGTYNDSYEEISNHLNDLSQEEYNELVTNNPETFKDVDVNDRDAVAKKIAREAADTTFKIDYVNTVFDIFELWTLRGTFGKGTIERSANSPAIARANRISKMFQGTKYKTFEEAEAAYKQLSKKTRFGYWLADHSKAWSGLLGAESSEGVEEAVNYIAQMEGMNVARVALGITPESSFDKRFTEYINSPQLWESAFWGVLGGVVFQNLGSGMNRVAATIKDGKLEEKSTNKNNDETGETKKTVGWRGLANLPEVERRVSDIKARYNHVQLLADELNQIRNNKIPGRIDAETGVQKEFDNPIDREAAERLKKDEFILNLTLQSMENGNFDLTRSFFENDEVRKGILERINEGAKDEDKMTEEQSKAWQLEVLQKMDEIQSNYIKDVNRLTKLASDLDRNKVGIIPVEYIQLAATQNARNRLAVKSLTDQKQRYETAFREGLAQAIDDGKLNNPTAAYEDLLKYEALAFKLSELYKEKDRLTKKTKQTETDNVAVRDSLHQINNKINRLQSELINTEDNLSLHKAMWAMSKVLGRLQLINGDGRTEDMTKLEQSIVSALDDQNIDDFQELLGISKEKRIKLVDEKSDKETIDSIYNKLLEDYKKFEELYNSQITGRNGKGEELENNQSLDEVNTEIADNYRIAMQLEDIIADNKAALVGTRKELSTFINDLNNHFDEARKTAINASSTTIKNLANKYSPKVIREIITEHFENGKIDYSNRNQITEQDREELAMALKILNFSNPANILLYRNIESILQTAERKLEEDKSDYETNDDNGENSTSLENLDTGLNSTDPINSSQNGVQSNTESENGQNGNVPKSINNSVDLEQEQNKEESDNLPTGGIPETPSNNAAQNVQITPGSNEVGNGNINAKPLQLSDEDFTRGVQMSFDGKVDFTAEDIDFDAIAQQVKDEIVDKNPEIDQEKLDAEIANRVQLMRTAHNQLKEINSNLGKNGAALAFAAKSVEPETTTYSSLFTNTFARFVEEYTKTVLVPEVDGRKVINMRELLRICNNQFSTQDISVAKGMFNSIKNYLLNDAEAKSKYVIEDLEDTVTGEVLNKINKTASEIHSQYGQRTYSTRINIADIINMHLETLDTENSKKFFNVLDSLKKGDTVTMTLDRDGRKICFIKNGVILGEMPKPYIENDSFYAYNEGWKTDVKRVNGRIESNLLKLFSAWFTEDAYKDLREIIQKVNILSVNLDNIEPKYIKEFEQHPIIADLINRARNNANKAEQIIKNGSQTDIAREVIFVDWKSGNVDSKRLLKHLVKLWQYSNIIDNPEFKDTNIRNIKDNLYAWFDKLYDTYETLNNLNEPREVSISYINEGQKIELDKKPESKSDGLTPYERNKKPSEALDRSKKIVLAIGDVKNESIIHIADTSISSKYYPSWIGGRTTIAIFNRNQEPDLIGAFGFKMNDAEQSEALKQIGAAVKQRLTEAIKKIIDSKSESSLFELGDLLSSIIDTTSSGNKIPLLRAITGNFFINQQNVDSNFRHLEFSLKQNGKFLNFKIYIKDKFGNNKLGCSIPGSSTVYWENKDNLTAENIANQLYKFIEENSWFNISQEGIIQDSQKTKNYTSNHKGFIKYKDGKLIVDIPTESGTDSYHAEADTYSDYVLDNDLIKVNTEKNSRGTNFNHRFDNQNANQVMYVDLPSTASTPVESSNDLLTDINVNEDSNKEIYKEAINILTDNEENKVKRLISLVKGSSITDIIESYKTEFDIIEDIFPSNFVFDKEYNGDNDEGNILQINPYDDKELRYTRTKTSSRPILAANTVVFGSKFLNLISSNNQNNRNIAMRKLMHEQLHRKFAQLEPEQRKRLLDELQSIYDEFYANVEKDKQNPNLDDANKAALNHLSEALKGYKNQQQRRLEEFIVETLTNKVFFDYANNIKVKDVGSSNSESIFSKIARLIAKLFGWTINNESLYMKELNILRNFGNSNNITNFTENSEETKSKNNKEQKENNKEENDEEVNEDEGENIIEDDDEYSYEDDEDDEDAYSASIIEPVIDADGYHKIGSISSFIESAPIAEQAKLRHKIKQGKFNFKCK